MKNFKLFIVGFLISLLFVVIFVWTKIHPNISLSYEWPNFKESLVNNVQYVDCYSFHTYNGRVINLVNKSKKVFSFEFDSPESQEIVKVSYYYEKNGKLFVQKYNVEDCYMYYMGTEEIRRENLKGRNFWLVKKERNWIKEGFSSEVVRVDSCDIPYPEPLETEEEMKKKNYQKMQKAKAAGLMKGLKKAFEFIDSKNNTE